MATAAVTSFLCLVICLACFEVSVFSLRCRVDHDEETQRSFQDIVRSCMSSDFRDEDTNTNNNNRPYHNNNNNNNHNWQHNKNGPQWAGIPRFPTKDRRDRNDREDEEDDSRDSNNNNKNNKNRGFGYGGRGGTGRPRARRASDIGTTIGGGRGSPNNSHPFNRRLAEDTSLEEVEPCVIHCIFRQMQMLSGDKELDRGSVVRVMTGRLRDRQLRDFIREAIAECFDTIEQDNQDTKCSISKSFALCLEQKGQQNCEDWDDDMNKPKQKQAGINVNNKRRG